MSADSTYRCPQCYDPNGPDDEEQYTLYEYHEFHMREDGRFTAEYSCECGCGFRWHFMASREIDLAEYKKVEQYRGKTNEYRR